MFLTCRELNYLQNEYDINSLNHINLLEFCKILKFFAGLLEKIEIFSMKNK